jgi:hypothetical protein
LLPVQRATAGASRERDRDVPGRVVRGDSRGRRSSRRPPARSLPALRPQRSGRGGWWGIVSRLSIKEGLKTSPYAREDRQRNPRTRPARKRRTLPTRTAPEVLPRGGLVQRPGSTGRTRLGCPGKAGGLRPQPPHGSGREAFPHPVLRYRTFPYDKVAGETPQPAPHVSIRSQSRTAPMRCVPQMRRR